MLNARAVSYSDAHRHRIGANFNQLPVNKPLNEVNNYERDGIMSMHPKTDSAPNYFPNSFGGPAPRRRFIPPPICVEEGGVARYDMPIMPIDFEQPRMFYEELHSIEQEHLINNICNSLSQVPVNIQYRQCTLFYITSYELGSRVIKCLGLNLNNVIYLATLSQEDRVIKTIY